ncbi:MAG TPA: hypothetical protein VFI74_06000 [Candidatus Saccharimonadales bacterium]|nr:hypothetical protein [Candidatus Saccharimonadales bacterium]
MEHDPSYSNVGYRVLNYLDFINVRPPEEVIAFHGLLHEKARTNPDGEWRGMYVDFYEALGLYPEDVDERRIGRSVTIYETFASSGDPNEVLLVLGLLPRLWPFSVDGTVRVLHRALSWRGTALSCHIVHGAAEFTRQTLLGEGQELTFLLPRPQRRLVAHYSQLA